VDKERKLAVLYAAKSSPDEKGSIEDQLKKTREWALENGYEVVGEYKDENASAYKGNRGEDLALAMEHAEQMGATLIGLHSDRLARGDAKQARHLVEIALWAIKADVKIHCLEDPSTFENLLMAVVMGDRNMEDSRRKAASIKAGLARRRKRGLVAGAAPCGYLYERNEDDERRLVIDPYRAEVVRRIFDEYLAGRSLLSIAQGLDADGVLSPKGGRWKLFSVRHVLMNPIYAGLIRDDEGPIEGQHEAIVSRETWEAAEALRRAKTRTHKRGRNPVGKHLFRKGFLRCGVCGSAMSPRTERNRSGSLYECYSCLGRTGHGLCSVSTLTRAKVDDAVYAYFEGLDLDLEATRKQMASATKRKLAEARELLQQAQQEEREFEARLQRVKGDYFNGDLTAEEWRELRADLEPELEAAKAETQSLERRLQGAEQGTAMAQTQSEILEALSEVREALAREITDAEGAAALRAVLMRLFEGFTLHREGSGHDRLELAGNGGWIEPLVSEHVVDGYAESLQPAFSHTPSGTGEKYLRPYGPLSGGTSPRRALKGMSQAGA
jgi:site-specific DNA recombinase